MTGLRGTDHSRAVGLEKLEWFGTARSIVVLLCRVMPNTNRVILPGSGWRASNGEVVGFRAITMLLKYLSHWQWQSGGFIVSTKRIEGGIMSCFVVCVVYGEVGGRWT
jgi:hypothetical protein